MLQGIIIGISQSSRSLHIWKDLLVYFCFSTKKKTQWPIKGRIQSGSFINWFYWIALTVTYCLKTKENDNNDYFRLVSKPQWMFLLWLFGSCRLMSLSRYKNHLIVQAPLKKKAWHNTNWDTLELNQQYTQGLRYNKWSLKHMTATEINYILTSSVEQLIKLTTFG